MLYLNLSSPTRSSGLKVAITVPLTVILTASVPHLENASE